MARDRGADAFINAYRVKWRPVARAAIILHFFSSSPLIPLLPPTSLSRCHSQYHQNLEIPIPLIVRGQLPPAPLTPSFSQWPRSAVRCRQATAICQNAVASNQLSQHSLHLPQSQCLLIHLQCRITIITPRRPSLPHPSFQPRFNRLFCQSECGSGNLWQRDTEPT